MPSSTSSSEARGFVRAFAATLVVAVIAMAGATEWLVRTRVAPVHPFYAYLALFRTTAADSAAFGDSYAAYGLSGLAGMVDLAEPGDGFYAIGRKVRLFFAERAPDRVIIEAQPHHFSRAYVSWRDSGDHFPDFVKSGGVGWLRIASPVHRPELFRYWQEFLGRGGFVAHNPVAADGTRPGTDSFAARDQGDRAAMVRRQALMRQPVKGFETTAVAEEYRAVVAFLRAKGARVCLLTFPVSPGLQEAERRLSDYATARAWFDRLAAQAGARHVDLSDLSLPDDHFSDSDHLNLTGAQRVTPEALARCFGESPTENRVEAAPVPGVSRASDEARSGTR